MPVEPPERCVHFVTFSCKKRRRLLDTDQAKRIVIGSLGSVLSGHGGHCCGFVVMPDHVHAALWFDEGESFSEFMRGWKSRSSRSLREFVTRSLPNYAAKLPDGVIWQPKSYDFFVTERAKLEAKIDYMHLNPVRAGFVERAIEWPWSSARWYTLGRSVGIPIGWPDTG